MTMMESKKYYLNLQKLSLKSIVNAICVLCDNERILLYNLGPAVSYVKQVPPQIMAEICRALIKMFKKNQTQNSKFFNEKYIFFCVHLNSEEIFMNEFEKTLLYLSDMKSSSFKKLTFFGRSFPFPENDVNKSIHFRLFKPLYHFMSNRNLTSFHSVRMADDMMFSIFAEYCPNLEDIEIELCYTLTDEGVSYLCGFENSSEVENCLRTGERVICQKGCKNLKRLVLDFTMATNLSVAALLEWCPKIEILNVHPDINMENVFIMLQGYEPDDFTCKSFRLTTFHSYLEVEESIIYVIAKTCPNLKEVTLRFCGSERKDKNLLDHLLNLPITSLDVLNCNTEALIWFLERKGSDILTLEIEHLITAPQNVFINRSHLQSIILTCPNLDNFSLRMNGNISISPNIPYSSFGNGLNYFTNLKSLCIEGVRLESEDLKVMLIKCKDIEDIRLTCQNLQSLEDSLLRELLSHGALKKLKKLYVFRPFLTLAGLQMLLSECSQLEKVGPLSSWAIPRSDEEKLAEIQKNNWRVYIGSLESY